MKIVVDLGLLQQASAPLRDAATTAKEIHSGSRGIVEHADYAGDELLSSAIQDFAAAWGHSAQAIAGHGETLARMVDLATSAYTDTDQKAHKHSGVIGEVT
ncbi:MAG TPA: hypothetical protein VHC49_23795 [Mycobacteriales bacterium]|nr:hypothetical protein [Mycobacteriales bacterium]